jgi:co-chaperonin GroES (HSP10)
MKVLGHRVLIRPDEQNDTHGALILPTDREFVATSGTVVQVGNGGSAFAYHVRQRAIRDCLAVLSCGYEAPLIEELLGTADPAPELKPGDRVAFDADSGLRITVGGDAFLIIDHDALVIIVDEAEEAA